MFRLTLQRIKFHGTERLLNAMKYVEDNFGEGTPARDHPTDFISILELTGLMSLLLPLFAIPFGAFEIDTIIKIITD